MAVNEEEKKVPPYLEDEGNEDNRAVVYHNLDKVSKINNVWSYKLYIILQWSQYVFFSLTIFMALIIVCGGNVETKTTTPISNTFQNST